MNVIRWCLAVSILSLFLTPFFVLPQYRLLSVGVNLCVVVYAAAIIISRK
jgi:hypothetical protein